MLTEIATLGHSTNEYTYGIHHENNWAGAQNAKETPSTCLLCCLWHLLTPLSTVLNRGHGPVLLRG